MAPTFFAPHNEMTGFEILPRNTRRTRRTRRGPCATRLSGRQVAENGVESRSPRQCPPLLYFPTPSPLHSDPPVTPVTASLENSGGDSGPGAGRLRQARLNIPRCRITGQYKGICNDYPCFGRVHQKSVMKSMIQAKNKTNQVPCWERYGQR